MIKKTPAPLWKLGTGVNELCGSGIIPLSGAMVTSVNSGLILREEDAKILRIFEGS